MLDEIKDPRFTAIDIRAFRGLHDVRLEGLSRVNIIVGPNNAGKTSVLEAIEACCHPINIEAWLDMVRRRGSRQPLGEQFASLFPQNAEDETSQILEICYERRGEPSSWRVVGVLTRKQQLLPDEMVDVDNPLSSPTRIFNHVALEISPTVVTANTLPPVGSVVSFRAGETVSRTPHPEDVPIVSVTPITHRSEVLQIKMMAAFDAPQFRDDVVNLLKVFDCDVQGVEVYDPEGTRSYIRVWHKRTGYMPIAAFGDGFRRVLTYALAVIGCRNGGVLLIDEIETAIHYSALRKVYRWLVEACAEHRVQLFVTTHSLEAIDALLEATPETMDTSFYRLHEERGAVSVVRFDEPELRALREQFGDEVRG